MMQDQIQPSASIVIANNEEKISNSSTPLENEKLRRKASMLKTKNKIELNVEMTEEMKRQEQSLNFGATPYSSKSKSAVSASNTAANQNVVGNGVNALQRQKEFIECKQQGQQGVQSSPPKESSQQESQMDILDMIEERVVTKTPVVS